MTDNPGWTSPGSPEPADEAPPQAAAPAAAPGTSATSAPENGAPQPPHAPQDGPPAPQWGTPGPPPYPGHAGYGAPGPAGAPGAPGWGPPPPPYGGHPGWGVPPSPKPGVIPLRPLGVGELLDGAVTTVRKYWRTTLSLALGFAAFSQTVKTVLEWWAQQSGSVGVELVAALVPLALESLLGLVVGGLLTIVVSKGVLGEQVTLRQAWQSARGQLGRLVGLTLLVFLIILAVFLVAAVPPVLLGLASGFTPGVAVLAMLMALVAGGVACWLGITLSLASPALMLERQGVLTSLSRSRRLVKGSWWRILGINLLTSLILSIVSGVAVLPFAFLATMVGNPDAFDRLAGENTAALNLLGMVILAVGGTVVSTITIPVNAAMTVLIYIDRRIRREALDIELARAAGVSVQQPTGWAGPAVPHQNTPPGA
ncbi:hypothetical protein [Kitasatospora sp. NPDC094015]|uniref:DUF7544 domain-containing protein n=1 Tax=Kitasatospora sp. NPDC094015 TaxID=3155205 RepID=UPI003320111B